MGTLLRAEAHMRGILVTGVSLIALAGAAAASDLPTKAPPPAAAYDWTGFYLGGHLSYALGSSQWSSTQAGAPGPSGSLEFSNAYNFSNGAGSYLLGFQAGYDYMTASRWLLGVETDISFPSFVGGNGSFTTALTGQANYHEQVEFSGSLQGRIGYAPGHWLFYGNRRLGLELRPVQSKSSPPERSERSDRLVIYVVGSAI
jgi:high affinity Mn2+ porin